MLSQQQLLDLARNGEDGTIYTQEQLLAMDYATAPFAQGILSADYRVAFYDSPLSKPFQIRRPVLTRQGQRFRDVTEGLAGQPFSELRCLFWDESRRVQTEEFGWISQKQRMFSVLPEDIEMIPGDQVRFPDTPQSQRSLIEATEPLPKRPVDRIQAVFLEDGSDVPTSAYSASPDGIEWIEPLPAGTYVSVEYWAAPWEEWQPDEQAAQQRGADGLKLPQIGRLVQIAAQ